MEIFDFINDDILINKEYIDKILNVLATDKTDDGTITYEMNNHGYRSIPITEKSNKNILTLGCSWTMGIGVKNEDTWSYKLSKQLDDDVNLWNYGMYGVSGGFICKQLYKILNNDITPDYVLIMWPGFSRRDYFNENGEFKKIGGFRLGTPTDVVWKNEVEDKLFIELRNDYQDIMDFWMNYKFVENLGKSKKIRIFHTIAGYYYEVFKNNENIINKIIDKDSFFIPNNCYKNDFRGRDKEHPGKEWHENFANNFLNFIKDKI